jgi:hypothetical protein
MSDRERIGATQAAIDQLEATLASAVGEARANGATWEDVAGALGVARQSAWRRFREVGRVRKLQRRCSFCGLRQKRVRHLVVAPTGACICDECLDLASAMVGEERARRG